MNRCNAGPSPTGTPAPWTPAPQQPTPAPQSSTFTQKQCSDSACTQCNSYTFPQNQCLGLNGGGSAIAVCVSAGLNLTEYPSSTTCTGASTSDLMPINQCLQDNSGGYLENICNNGAGIFDEKRAIKKARRVV